MTQNIWFLYKLVLFSSLFIFAIFARQEWQQATSASMQQLNGQAHIISASLNMLLNNHNDVMDFMATAYEANPNDTGFLQQLTHSNIDEHGYYTLVQANGQRIAGDIAIDASFLDGLNQRLAAAKQSNQPLPKHIIGNSYYDLNQQTTVLRLVRPVYSPLGDVSVYIVATLHPTKTHILSPSEFKNPSQEIRIITKNYRILVISSQQFAQIPETRKALLLSSRHNAINADEAARNLTRYNDKPLEDIMATEQAHSAFFKLNLLDIIKSGRNNSHRWESMRLFSAQYNPTYELWTVVSNNGRTAITRFLHEIGIQAFTLILFHLILLYLTRKMITAERQKHLELIHQATHDPLTNLPNRQNLRQLGQQFLENSTCYVLLFIDLDKFKDVNDTYGHVTGDRILKSVAQRLKKFEKNTIKVFRESGDEFIMLLKNEDLAAATHYAQSILSTLTLPHKIYDAELVIGASIGIASYPDNGANIEELIRCADIAMYEAKQFRNNFRIFDEEIKQNHLERVHIEQNLGPALKNREIFIVYQPQFNHKGGFHGVEALARWRDKNGKFHPPNIFIAVAENCGQMPQLGRYIMDQVFEDMKYIHRQLHVEFQVSINISLAQLVMPDFVQKTFEALEASPLTPSQLTLELTESSLIDNLALVQSVFEQIRAQGIKLSLDDFGTGFSSLSLLGQLPIQELKIDKSFVDDITNEEKAVQMMRNIVSIGKNYNMAVLAEGVETEAQLNVLLKNSCDFFQGYFYAKPMHKDELIAFLKQNTAPNL